MGKQETETSSAGRELVEFLRLAGNVSIERQDLEIAASSMFADPSSFLDLYDLTVEIRNLRASSTRLCCDFAHVRGVAMELIMSEDSGGLMDLAGGAIPAECARRLDAARANPSLRKHFLSSAADHFAHHVMEALRTLTGSQGVSVTIDLPADFDAGRLDGVPYLSVLRREDTVDAR